MCVWRDAHILTSTNSVAIDTFNINVTRDIDTAEDITKKSGNLSTAKQLTTFAISVLIHLLVIIALIFASHKLLPPAPIKEKEIKAIKSYLYQRPKPVTKQPEPKQIKPKAIETVVKKPPAKTAKLTKDKPIEKSKGLIQNTKTEQAIKQVTNKVIPEKSQLNNKKNTNIKPNFSSRAQLQKLRNSINSQIMQQEFEHRTVKRSASIMHAPQIPVPNSIVPLTSEQKRAKNTSKSNAISITKHDDGTCTLEREQFLGSPVEATASSFACGESKLDKSFRAHMKKVQQKLAPLK